MIEMWDAEFGELIAYTTTSIKEQVRRIFEGLVVGVIHIGLTYLFYDYTYGAFISRGQLSAGSIFISIFIILTGIGVVGIFWDFMSAYGNELFVYKGGIEHRSRRGVKRWHWHDFESLRYKNTHVDNNGYKTHAFMLRLRDKNKQVLRLDKIYEEYEQLGQVILNITTSQWIQRDIMRLQRGETLKYGSISADKKGIKKGSKQLAWSELQSIKYRMHLYFLGPQDAKVNLFGIGDKIIRGNLYKGWNTHLLPTLIQTITKMSEDFD